MSDLGTAAIWTAIGAVIAGLFAWLVQSSKGTTDIEVAVIAEWQKLNLALSERVSALEKTLSEVRSAHAKEMEEIRNKHRTEMRRLRELNEGLQRQIAQNSQSTAHLMGEPGEKKP